MDWPCLVFVPGASAGNHGDRSRVIQQFLTRKTLFAAAVVLMLGFFSMGALGGALYLAVSPVLAPFFGHLDSWHGDWVWPATVCAGMLWAVGFLLAGWLDRCLLERGVKPAARGVAYAVTLWLAGAVCWTGVLLVSGP